MYYLYKILWIIWIPILFRVFKYTANYWSEEFKANLFDIYEVHTDYSPEFVKFCLIKKLHYTLPLLGLMHYIILYCNFYKSGNNNG